MFVSNAFIFNTLRCKCNLYFLHLQNITLFFMDISNYLSEYDLVNGRNEPLVTLDCVRKVQNDILENAKNNKESKIFVPQEGFQERVLECDADIMIIGGKRGGGKTFVMGLAPIYDIDNPLFTFYGFRKEEGDLKRGFIKSTTPIYQHIASYSKTDMSWDFTTGAIGKFEQLQNKDNVDRRFRGVELPLIMIDELPQLDSETFFTLLASNRNTIGVRNKFIASCNPVGQKHWVYQFISWYINEETGEVHKDRVGKIRYFFKPSKSISEIVWGNSKAEVYEKAKYIIDDYLTADDDPYDMITSFCFIEGDYADNKIFKTKDPSYKGRLSAQGGKQAKKDIKGIWTDDDDGVALLSESDFDNMFNNQEQVSGMRYAVADVALKGDYFVIGAFNGRHLFDIEFFTNVTSDSAIQLVRGFLEKNDIREENFTYDANGIGLFLEGFFKKSIGFNNKKRASNPNLWASQKSECAERFIKNVKENKWSISKDVLNRIIHKTGETVEERLQKERLALKRKVNDTGVFDIISKPQMILEIGHSPDFLEMLFMRESFGDKTKLIKNISML